MPEEFKIALCIMVSFSIVGAILVILDKYNAVHRLYRISESTLMFFGVFGGALLMFAMMKLCRHKTQKPKFILTFPLISALHIIILLLLL